MRHHKITGKKEEEGQQGGSVKIEPVSSLKSRIQQIRDSQHQRCLVAAKQSPSQQIKRDCSQRQRERLNHKQRRRLRIDGVKRQQQKQYRAEVHRKIRPCLAKIQLNGVVEESSIMDSGVHSLIEYSKVPSVTVKSIMLQDSEIRKDHSINEDGSKQQKEMRI
jgi:hypothetical protein